MAARAPLDSTDRSVSGRPVPDIFESFDLSIERIDGRYRAEVTASPVGPRSPIDIDAEGLAGDVEPPGETDEPTRDVRRRPVDRKSPRHRGESLFRAVFVGAIEAAFRASVERSKGKGVGLRICLQLSRASELADAPWEALWDSDGKVFLAAQPNLCVVRTLDVPAGKPDVTPVKAPLRVLALLPEPRGEPKLSGADEWRRIGNELVEARGIEAETLEPPTLDALRERIDDGPCHVLHVVAHGGPGPRGSGGLLKLEDGSGGVDPVTGTDFTLALERGTTPRLVVLSTCHSARAADDDAFDGLAQLLLSRGIPAVVAMRTTISNDAAVSFSTTLYRELARGRCVEGAMVEARRALSGARRNEWATPALYLRGRNLRILDRQASGGASPGRRVGSGRLAGALLAAVAVVAGALGLWMSRFEPTDEAPDETLETPPEAPIPIPPDTGKPPTNHDPCPPPLGLEDLRFVKIDPDVVDLGDRSIIVEKAFCIGTKEVSRRDWLAVMGGDLPRSKWPLDWPMTVSNPDETSDFLEQLGAREPEATFRLPTEAEWELAARAGTTTDYFFGDDPAKLFQYGNCTSALETDGHEVAAPVGSYPPNDWGLYDVHGNVAEWVAWPPGTETPVDDDGSEQALRLGGSYAHAPASCAFGSWRPVKADAYRGDTGFRVVRDLALGTVD